MAACLAGCKDCRGGSRHTGRKSQGSHAVLQSRYLVLQYAHRRILHPPIAIFVLVCPVKVVIILKRLKYIEGIHEYRGNDSIVIMLVLFSIMGRD